MRIHLVQRAIDFMEDRLSEALSLPQIARHVHLSPWHFQRLFQLFVGESAATYLRKRKMHFASHDLLETNKRILDIALELGFASHESFTRSFKQIVGVTPDQFRLLRQPFYRYPRLSYADSELFAGESDSAIPEVKIVFRDTIQVTGKREHGLEISSDGSMADNQKKIAGLWRSIESSLSGQANQTGVIIPTVGLKFDYMAGFLGKTEHSLQKFELWETLHIPAIHYAVSTHIGPIEELPRTFKRMVGNWMPGSNYELIPAPELEIYEYDSHDRMKVDVYLPVRRKK